MLLTSVATKTVRDRTPLALMIGLGLATVSFLFASLAASLETEIAELSEQLPEAFAGIMGGSGSNYVISELFGLLAPIGVLVVAISGAINVLAREENRRTVEVLLTQPVTRRSVVIDKAKVLLIDLLIVSGLLLSGGVLAASAVDVEGFSVGGAAAASVHVFFLGLAFAMATLAVANVTGSGGTALGFGIGAAVLSNLTAGLLPLIEGWEDVARVSPWYYFNGSDPLTNGVAFDHLAVLGVLSGIGFAVSVWVVERRDLGSERRGPRFAVPAIGAVVRPRLGGVFVKTLTEHSTMLVMVSASMALLSLLVSVMYNGLQSSLADLSEALPESFAELLGSADMGTPEGWIQVEMLSMMVPLALVAIGIVFGSAAIAGEDARRTLGLVVAASVSRGHLVVAKSLALIVAVSVVGVAVWASLVAGSLVAGLGLDPLRLGAALVHHTMLAIFLGLFVLAIGSTLDAAATTRTGVAVAIVTYFADWLFGLRDSLERLRMLSPWFYVTDAEPLFMGVRVAHVAVLAAGSAVCVAAATWLFDRRDINT